MSKKSFTSGLDQLLRPSHEANIPKEKGSESVKAKSIRATFVVNSETMGKIHALAYYQRKELKSILEEAFSLYIEKYGITELEQALQLHSKKLG